MSALSNVAENAILDAIFNATAYSVATPFVALFTSDPGDDGSGTEVSGGSYVRQALSCGAASGGSCSNDAQITFSGMPAATVTHFAVYDAASAGNLIWHGALTASKTVGSGDELVFNVGQLVFTAA